MNNPTDNYLNEFEPAPPVYGTFKERVLASFIDSLILIPLVALDWFNKSDWKSQLLLISVFFIGVIYKPLWEFKYGATIGKKSMNLLVVNKNFQQVNLKEVLVRNIFDISWRTFFFVISLIVYRSPEFVNITSNQEFVAAQSEVINTNPYVLIYSAIIIIEIAFLLTDEKKRALHDRIGDTLVIRATNNRT